MHSSPGLFFFKVKGQRHENSLGLSKPGHSPPAYHTTHPSAKKLQSAWGGTGLTTSLKCSVVAKRGQELLPGWVQAGPTLQPYRLYRSTCMSNKEMVSRWQSGLGAGFGTWGHTSEKQGCHTPNAPQQNVAMEKERMGVNVRLTA